MSAEGRGKCLNCGFEPPADANFCPNCGAARRQAQDQQQSATRPPQPPPASDPVVRGIGYTFGGCIFIVAIFALLSIAALILLVALSAFGQVIAGPH